MRPVKAWSLAKLPTAGLQDGLSRNRVFSSIAIDTTNRMASAHIRAILYGARCHLDAVLGQRLWSRATRLQACDLLIQSTRAGTTWKLLSNFLQRSGWKKRQRLLAWHQSEMQTEQCVHSETTIRFSRDSLQACLRAIRHSWRRILVEPL